MTSNQPNRAPVDTDRVQELMRNIEHGVREFGPLDLIDIHTSLGELLKLRNDGAPR